MTYSEEEYNAILAVCRSYKNDYDSAFERLKAQQQEIYGLKAENKQLKTECALLDDELRIARQDTIDVLNELKNRLVVYYPSVISEIDELLKEYEE